MRHPTASVIRPHRGRIVASVIAAALAIAGSALAAPAANAVSGATITVNTTQDLPAGTCGSTPPTGAVSLRIALCVANNMTGPVTIQVPAGTYSIGSTLDVGTASGADITIEGTGLPVIDGGGTVQIFTLDPGLVGNVTVAVDGVEFAHGNDTLYGGGAIVAGSGGTGVDTLTVSNSTFTSNSANKPGQYNTTVTGGAILFQGGSLSVTGSTFTDNTAYGSSGGAISYSATGSGQSLAISASTFTGNTAGPGTNATIGGGAVYVTGQGGSPSATISGSTFVSNQVASGADGIGGAVLIGVGGATVTASTFTGNSVAGSGAAGAAMAVQGTATLTAHDNRIAGNTGAAALDAQGATNAGTNWWGCNAGPGTTGCDAVNGLAASAYTPWLQLHVSADPVLIQSPATTSVITADLLSDSSGASVPAAGLGAFSAASVGWALSGGGSLSAASGAFDSGAATTTYTAGGSGSAQITARLDGQSVTVTVGQATAPAFTGAASASVASGAAFSVPISSTGSPAPTLSVSGQPTWVAVSGAALAGTAPAGTTGSFTFTLTASNGVKPDATEQFTLIVTAAPVVTAAPSDIVAVPGSTASFSATATGYPTPTVQWQVSGDSGASFTDVSGATDGTLSFPAALAQSGNQYRAVFTNSAGTAATNAATLRVGIQPSFTSVASASFTVGTAGSFDVTTSGSPAPTVTATGLPAWLTLNAGDQLVGIPPAGSGGTYSFTLTAANGFGSAAVQTFSLTVHEAPAITLAPVPASANSGTQVSFSATAEGFPAPAAQWQVSTNGGATFTDIVGATAPTYSFTANLSEDGNQYRVVFANSVGSATSAAATLAVGTGPAFTSSSATTFTVGGGTQTFDVAMSGHPVPSLTATGLPAWLTLAGSTLTGEPPAGSGGTYAFTLHASNAFESDVRQNFVLTVNEAPGFTSANAISGSAGATLSFPVTTSHAYPVPSVLTLSGALPAGVSFTDDGNGSGLISGIPATGSGGVYPVVITTVGGTAVVAQHVTITVNEAPAFTSRPDSLFTRGVDGSFTVTTGHAYPAPAITLTGALPNGLAFTDNGDGTATIAGTTTDAAGAVNLTIVASNGFGPAESQTMTLTVQNAPVVPLPLLPPAGAGALGGVPAQVQPSQVLTVTGDGFAAFATVNLGFYSSPTSLGTVTADAAGRITAAVAVPAQASGAHTFVAAGTGSDGEPLYLSAGTSVLSQAAAAEASAIAATGLPEDAVGTGMLAALALLLGCLVLAGRAVRRRHARTR
ncbi:hypothetical protein GCM10028798_11070 [Humibacter antri]